MGHGSGVGGHGSSVFYHFRQDILSPCPPLAAPYMTEYCLNIKEFVTRWEAVQYTQENSETAGVLCTMQYIANQ